MSRSQATILTNMCLIEDGHGNIVMQIRDPKRYSWSVLPYPVVILKHTRASGVSYP